MKSFLFFSLTFGSMFCEPDSGSVFASLMSPKLAQEDQVKSIFSTFLEQVQESSQPQKTQTPKNSPVPKDSPSRKISLEVGISPQDVFLVPEPESEAIIQQFIPSPEAQSGGCYDLQPSSFNCSEQARLEDCDAPYMQTFCALSCGKCSPLNSSPLSPYPTPSVSNPPPPPSSPPPPPSSPPPPPLNTTPPCEDVPPNPGFVCSDQINQGRCGAPFMKNFCDYSCGRCNL